MTLPWSRGLTCAALSVCVASCGSDGGQFPMPPDMAFGNACQNPPLDSDHDGISDANEGAAQATDTDHDGVPDYLDTDSDNDGIPDAVEARNGNPCTPPVDTDHDGVADFRDLDSDDANDSTIPDHVEAGSAPATPVDTDSDGKPDYMDTDDDGDGILDILEMTPQGAKQAALTLATAPDTDLDGIPDYLDLDSDGDTILDSDEHDTDVDGDFIPNYRDLDSDGDCVADAFEAGDADLQSVPVDTDFDGIPDFVDIDSDNDGLVDGSEDKNCDGIVQNCETSRTSPDTDADGISDLIEVEACLGQTAAVQAQTMCACDGDNIDITPAKRGTIIFLSPYGSAPYPSTAVVSLSNSVDRADVLFVMDTTSAMQKSLNDLADKFGALASTLGKIIPDLAFGVYEFRDLGTPQMQPTSNPPNVPSFAYDQRVETVTGAGLAAVETALGGLVAQLGGDTPQAGWSALYTLADTVSRVITVLSSTTYMLDTNASTSALSTGESGGAIGGAGFRSGAVPIVVTVTGAEWHDAPGSKVAADAESGLNPYPSTDGQGNAACNPCTNVPSRREAITALQAIGAHVLGVAAVGSTTVGAPKTRALKVALETGAIVTPADFGDVLLRGAQCALTDCCTGLGGMGEPSQGGQCPLAFTTSVTDGTGVAAAVQAGVLALASGLLFNVHAVTTELDTGTIANFMQSVAPDISGIGPASMCVTMPPAPLQDNYTGPQASPGSDGTLDTFPGLQGGQLVCFDLTPKTNTTIMPTATPQLFRAQLFATGVSGQNSVTLGVPRTILFLVPPAIPTPTNF